MRVAAQQRATIFRHQLAVRLPKPMNQNKQDHGLEGSAADNAPCDADATNGAEDGTPEDVPEVSGHRIAETSLAVGDQIQTVLGEQACSKQESDASRHNSEAQRSQESDGSARSEVPVLTAHAVEEGMLVEAQSLSDKDLESPSERRWWQRPKWMWSGFSGCTISVLAVLAVLAVVMTRSNDEPGDADVSDDDGVATPLSSQKTFAVPLMPT